jgi:hypothetical protein
LQSGGDKLLEPVTRVVVNVVALGKITNVDSDVGRIYRHPCL